MEGRNIASQIEAASQLASVHIAIFYANYVQVHWCLDELDLIMKSRAPIIPFFYNVKPHPLPGFAKIESVWNACRGRGSANTLDIACFFIGEDRDIEANIRGTVALRNLENKCMMEVDMEII